jgi:hypothetical protein
MAGDFSTHAPIVASPAVFSTDGAAHTSPGQRPGSASSFHPALKGRPNRCLAPSGLGMFLDIAPRALPWAIAFSPFGAGHRRNARARYFSRNAAGCESPGCNPGLATTIDSSALKGPDRAAPHRAESAKLEQAIKANLRGLGYGG